MDHIQSTLNVYASAENTHNYCTKEKCTFNPKEQIPSAGDADVNKCIANFCIGCGINMGDCNPRQYCYKIYCPFEQVDNSDVD